jgi:hypothetical protein
MEAVKGKVVSMLNQSKHYAMKTCGNGCIEPRFLHLGTSWT